MPSRQTFLVVDAAPPSLPPLPTSPPFAAPPPSQSSRTHVFLIVGFGLGGSVAAFVAIFLLFHILGQRLRAQKRHCSCSKVRRFSHRELNAATRSFSSDCKLGQGGFGAVFKGVLPDGQEIAVKRLDTTSLQGEREFQNELSIIGNVSSPHIVGLLGFCANGKKRLLVYEYMHNRSLQEALFDDEYPVSLDWGKRFNIIVDTAKALAFLHKCDPSIIHGDVKPSNVLLDWEFSARLADFGLARLKSESEVVAGVGVEQPQHQQHHRNRRRRRSAEREKRDVCKNEEQLPEIVDEEKLAVRQSTSSKESPSIFTASPISTDVSSLVDKQVHDYQEQDKKVDYAREGSTTATRDSPVKEQESSPIEPVEIEEKQGEERPSSYATEELSTFLELEAAVSKDSQPDICYDMLSVDSGKDVQFVGTKSKEKKRGSFGRDWWWRQESSGELSGKDYVLQWMEHDRKEEKLPASKECSLTEEQSAGEEVLSLDSWKEKRRDTSRSSEWWGSVSQEEVSSEAQSEKRRKEKCKAGDVWQWWKDQESGNTQQLSKKSNQGQKKKADKGSWRSASLEWWRDDNSEDEESTKSKKNCKGDRENINRCREWWKDDSLAKSQELKARKKKREQNLSREWWSGDLLSKGLNSTPSMRGTICYVAPEYGGNGVLSEKSDVYSFGVLLLVIISGRRPLQVMASPITQFERANLISWARHLAHTGNVLDLVDAALNGDYCRDQASLCITVALLCLQRLPAARPSMADVVKFLLGEAPAPALPMEFSPSPPCRHRYKSRKQSLSSESVN